MLVFCPARGAIIAPSSWPRFSVVVIIIIISSSYNNWWLEVENLKFKTPKRA